MYGLKPRHRRKAGSGPPANALIAWIGADPYLRKAAVTANHRREIALPPPANSRTAKAAVAACIVLAFSAVLGITTLSDGLVVPPETKMSPPPPSDPPHQTDHESGSAQLMVPRQQQGTGKTGSATPPLGTGGTGHPGTPVKPGHQDDPDPGESGHAPASPGPDHHHYGGPRDGTDISRRSGSPAEHRSHPGESSTPTPGARSGRR